MAIEEHLSMDPRHQHPDMEPAAASSAHPGLEVEVYPGLEVQPHSDEEFPQTENTRQRTPSAVPKSEKTNTTEPSADTHRRILGLTTRVFWGLLVALILLVAGAIGGGVGAGLALQQRSSGSTAAAAPTATTTLPPGQQPTAGGCVTLTVTTLLPILQPETPKTNCPGANSTLFNSGVP
ncbi:hypothetical protein PG993_008304 [Apiospora rasikravindrae]|uniref:Uncharacterized protein n=1 Tax=Apiospora rasikravindrae TaxID=990691 RepID=A0ABR1SZY7_9PEZI